MNRGAACPDTQSLRSKRSLLARGVRRVGATDLEDHVGGSFPLGDLHRCSTQGGGDSHQAAAFFGAWFASAFHPRWN